MIHLCWYWHTDGFVWNYPCLCAYGTNHGPAQLNLFQGADA